MKALAPGLATALAVVATTVAGASPAASASGQPSCDGVLVVVDPGPLGGGVRETCAPETGGSAAEVMASAGVRFTYAEGQPFVCRIDDLPDRDREDCRGTPPGDAYWGLFWSDGRVAEWQYSSLGLAALDVPAGGAIGWRFQDGGERQEPRAALAATTARTPATATTGKPSSMTDGGEDDPDDGASLTWLAGGAVLLLAAASGVLALRRRR